MEQPRGGPWLMSVNTFDPHGPFDAPSYQQRYLDRDLPPAIYGDRDAGTQERLRGAFFQHYSGPAGDKQRRQKASYYGMIELIDEQVGRMLDALERTGQRDNTVVIFMSDHGEMLGDHGLTAKGCRFYEGAVRVPLIVSWPGRFRQGLVADGLVELTDVAPTLTELTGEPLQWTNGRSLLPILTGQADPAHHRDHARCEYYDALTCCTCPRSWAVTPRAGPPCTATTATSWSPTRASTTASSTTSNPILWSSPTYGATRPPPRYAPNSPRRASTPRSPRATTAPPRSSASERERHSDRLRGRRWPPLRANHRRSHVAAFDAGVQRCTGTYGSVAPTRTSHRRPNRLILEDRFAPPRIYLWSRELPVPLTLFYKIPILE